MKHIFRKGIAILLTLTIAISMCLISLSVQAVTNNTVYLKPSSNWYQDGARFAVYFFNNSNSAPGWASMTLVEDGIYSAQLPSNTYTNVIFCRMNPANSLNNWDNRWNQTSDLTIPTDGKNCYTIAEGSWSYGSGSWSVYNYVPPVTVSPTTVPPVVNQPSTYRVVVGDANTDNIIDVKDVTHIQRGIAFEAKLSDEQTVANDINADKIVNIKDVTALKRYLCDYDDDYGKTGFYYGETPVKGNLLRNGKFEVNGETEKNLPFGWVRMGYRNADLKIIPSDRAENSICLRMENKKDEQNAVVMRLYNLEPGEIYKLSGYMKTENISADDTANGAYLEVREAVVVETSENNWRKGTTEWAEERVYFVPNSNGQVEIACRSDYAGVVYFDSLSVTKIPDYNNDENALKVCLSGKYVDSYFHKDVVNKYTKEQLQKWIDSIDIGYEYNAELMGKIPYYGEKIAINSTNEPSVKNVIAYAGNPIMLNSYYEANEVEAVISMGNIPFGMIHEIGHVFDFLIDWSFELEVTTNYKILYVLDKTGGTVLTGDNIPVDGKGAREYYKTHFYDHSIAKRNGIYDVFGMLYIFSRFTDEVGWDAVKATFREFGESMPKLTTSLGKLTYYMYRLQENYNKLNPDASGTEIRDSFPEGELEYLKQLVTTVKDGGYYVASEDYFK